MLRETDTQHSLADYDESVWPVLNRDVDEPIPAVVDAALPFRAAAAMPDVPASAGFLLFGSYMGLVAALAVATAGPGESKFVLAISALFVLVFFTVPRLIFAQEPRDCARPAMDQFIAKGLQTYTGHCSGGEAMMQMLIVPVGLTMGVLIIALEIAFIG